MMNNGAGLKLVAQKITETIEQANKYDKLSEFAATLKNSLDTIIETTLKVGKELEKGHVNLALANATLYLDMFGHMVIGWHWLRMAIVATEKLSDNDAKNPDFYHGKLVACQYFYRYEMPRIKPWSDLIKSIDDTTFKTSAEIF
nr:acyl-CoA dehydrogenase C-terminal domain-containing protein [Sneathiella glossodoripedis]